MCFHFTCQFFLEFVWWIVTQVRFGGFVWWFHFVVNDSRRIWPRSGVSTCCGSSFQFRICCKVSYESFDRPNNFQGSPLVHVQDIRYASQIIPTFPEYSNVKKHEKAMHTENSWAGCVSSGHLRKLLVMNLVPKSQMFLICKSHCGRWCCKTQWLMQANLMYIFVQQCNKSSSTKNAQRLELRSSGRFAHWHVSSFLRWTRSSFWTQSSPSDQNSLNLIRIRWIQVGTYRLNPFKWSWMLCA